MKHQYFICFLCQCCLNSRVCNIWCTTAAVDFYLNHRGTFSSKLYVFYTRWFYWFCHSILGLSAPEQGVFVRKLRAQSVATLVSQLKRYKVHTWPVAYEQVHSASSCVCCCMCLCSSHILTFAGRSCRGSGQRWTVWNIMSQGTGTYDNTMYTFIKVSHQQ